MSGWPRSKSARSSFVRDPLMLAVVVEARGLRDAEATIVLEQRINENEWEAVANQRVVLGEDGILKRTTFRITPRVVGQYEFRAKVEDAGPELTQEDNVATAAVRVVRQQIRVLLIAGSPSPEVQFLRNALDARPARRICRLASARRSRVPPARRSADQPAAQRLGRAAQLRRACCWWTPTCERSERNGRTCSRTSSARRGAALIFVAGELYSQQLFEAAEAQLGGSKLDANSADRARPGPVPHRGRGAALEPVNLHARALAGGRGDPVFEFNADPIRNRAILTSLPGMYWSFPVTRSRPGATVLARHGDPRMQNQYGRQPLLTSQLYGPGRTVFIGFDSTYRWRYLSEDYFDGFWARLVDRVGRNKALGGRFPFSACIWERAFTGSVTRSRWACDTPIRRRWPRRRSSPPSSKSPERRPSRCASRRRPTTPVS